MSDPTTTPPARGEFVTTDPESAREYLAGAYGTGLRMAPTAVRPRFRFVRVDAGPFTVDELQMPADLDFDADAVGRLIVTRIDAGAIERRSAGSRERFAAGEIYVSARPDLPYSARTLGLEAQTVTLDLSLLRHVAGAPDGEAPGPLRFDDFRPVTPAAAENWKRTAAYVTERLLTNAEAAAQPLIIGNAARLLAASALTAFPNTIVPAPAPRDRADSTPAMLRRAIAFIDANADRDISVADMAEAARVTPRALQYAFRRHRGTTPTAYLRRVRLARAHEDLRRADPTRGDTVTAIAARWGFLHFGRFAAEYRRAYGQTPRTTLHS
ncbi:helix-turn-helix transcriptional regulator [Actinoallomurus iriomotensis]|uniref:HTH araC/xylS-type domain-containing protein n=1 Tax=Actinoallomurus iriomotensis TaxID=478107 RepID=A0A9W6RL88_9ACTN|nr:helix-turn-helix transcriptional regulator [Actinoallomurus iriomotensis]GLY77748.1 hypothetical protein Airi01_060150 [Actinoallomurus iriomotensis]